MMVTEEGGVRPNADARFSYTALEAFQGCEGCGDRLLSSRLQFFAAPKSSLQPLTRAPFLPLGKSSCVGFAWMTPGAILSSRAIGGSFRFCAPLDEELPKVPKAQGKVLEQPLQHN